MFFEKSNPIFGTSKMKPRSFYFGRFVCTNIAAN
jgi:hypothetical protein